MNIWGCGGFFWGGGHCFYVQVCQSQNMKHLILITGFNWQSTHNQTLVLQYYFVT